ncbi:MAG: biotin/lipoyl-binding protein [Oscillospiraceae bacterium]|nr:biotin/lipoyl-binding protein [Oscillospiraceae bacterium]
MRKYRVNVNGTAYEVEIEEITGAVPSPAAAAPAPAAAAPAPTAAAGSENITSPMPGTILSVNVTKGQAVKKGQVLMVLEAMKMENEIMCPRDGTIVSVDAVKGAAVETGALLCVLG